MDYMEACDKLAQMIIAGEFYDPGGAIQIFSGAIDNDETPKMALTIANQSYSFKHMNDDVNLVDSLLTGPL